MNSIRSLVPLTCLFLAIAVTAQVPGEQAIINPGFEAGDLSGWDMTPGDDPKAGIVTDMVAEGENAAKISGGTGAFYKVVTNDITLVPGAFYCVVGKVVVPSTDPLREGQSAHLASKAVTPDGDVWFESPKVFTSEDDTDVWTQVYAGVTVPEDVTELTLEIKWTGTGSDDPGSIYVDDFKIIRMETPASIANLSFEDPEDSLHNWQGGWATWSYLPVDPPVGEETWIDTNVARTGDHSFAVVPQEWSSWSDDWGWWGYYSWTSQAVYDTVDYFQEGDNFYMSAWVMSSGDEPLVGDVHVDLELTFKDVDGTNLSNLGYENARVWSQNVLDENSALDDWHFIEAYIQCPPLDPEHLVERVELNVRLYQTDEAWGIGYADDIFIARGTDTPSAITENPATAPGNFSLAQNYPNPFNPSTTISYELAKQSHVELAVYNVLGKRVATLLNEKKQAGVHTVPFHAGELPSGTFLYTLKVDDQMTTRKMVLMR